MPGARWWAHLLTHWMLQIVIHVVEQKQRPTIPAVEDMPTPPPTCWTRYKALMERCWANEVADRPAFEAIIVDLRHASSPANVKSVT